jgi:hypothetical protein
MVSSSPYVGGAGVAVGAVGGTAGAGFEMAVLQKRILHKRSKVSEVLVF